MVSKNESKLIPFEEGTPKAIVRQAIEAAKTLQKIVSSRPKKLVISGKQYPFFEDWQTLGWFYNTTAKVSSTNELMEDGKLIGFRAVAIALKNGEEISAGEAECTFDEDNWKGKPRFQLRSMAQTRACSKALRNCLAWIAVLAGYEPTPAEELDREETQAPQSKSSPVKAPASPVAPPPSEVATQAQRKKIFFSARQMGYQDNEVRVIMKDKWGVEHTKELTKEQASSLIQMIERGEGISPAPADLEQAEQDIKDF